MVKERTSLDDLGYFDAHPAQMYEAMAKLNPASVINSTTPHYGPLLYTLARAIGVVQALEIGVAQGWTGGFMAWAIKENNERYKMNGKYYGIDVQEKSHLLPDFEEHNLPVEFIHSPSVEFLENQNKFECKFFDMIYIDGFHNTQYVKREVELCYPLLKGNGDGYLVMHDIYAYCEDAFDDIVDDPRYEWEYIRILPNYGLGILRKMQGYDITKVFWPEGDQKTAEGYNPNE